MIENLIEAVYKMYTQYDDISYCKRKPEIVMICTPKAYCEIRGKISDKIRYERDIPNYHIPILEIIGIRIPVIIRNDMPENVEFQLMYRKEYERLEQEEMYKRIIAMFE